MTTRHTVDSITSGELDQLYDERDAALKAVEYFDLQSKARKARGDTYRDAWYSARDRARKARDRADRAEAAIERVRAIHTRVLRMEALVCACCGHAWPCSTIQALDEQQPTTKAAPAVTIHACPGPDDNGISPCCKRPPFEFRGERITRDPANVTCPGPEQQPTA